MFKGSRAQNRVLNFADSEVKEWVIFFSLFSCLLFFLIYILYTLIHKFKSHRKEVIGNVEIRRAWKVLFHVDRWWQEKIKNNNTIIPIVLEFRSVFLIRLFMFCTRLSRFVRSEKIQQANMAKPLLAYRRPPEMKQPFLRMDERRLRKTETLLRVASIERTESLVSRSLAFFWTIIRSKSSLTKNISPIYTNRYVFWNRKWTK